MRLIVLVAATSVACSAPLDGLRAPASAESTDDVVVPVDAGTTDGGRPWVGARPQLSSHWDHTCRIDSDGRLACWGHNAFGQLGDGLGVDSTEPVVVPGRWREVSAGIHGTCAIDGDGGLWCWGALGYFRRHPPARLGDASDWLHVAAGAAVACGIRAGGALWCWGDDSPYDTSNDGRRPRFEPAQIAGVWSAVDLHWYRIVALTEDGALATFDASQGRGARPPSVPVEAFAALDTTASWRAVRVGVGHDYAMAADGSVWRRRLDTSPWSAVDVEAAVPLIGSAGYHLCVLEASGSLACHERDESFGGDEVVPIHRVMGKFVSVAHSLDELCAVDVQGATSCWSAPHHGTMAATARRVP